MLNEIAENCIIVQYGYCVQWYHVIKYITEKILVKHCYEMLLLLLFFKNTNITINNYSYVFKVTNISFTILLQTENETISTKCVR